MAHRKNYMVIPISALLIALFVYTATSKIADFDTFSRQMLNQPLPRSVREAAIWLVPLAELAAAICLSFRALRLMGLYLSFLLLLSFTIYVALVLAKAFAFVPCSCGGIVSSISWQAHLGLNIFFLLLSALAIGLQHHLNKELARMPG